MLAQSWPSKHILCQAFETIEQRTISFGVKNRNTRILISSGMSSQKLIVRRRVLGLAFTLSSFNVLPSGGLAMSPIFEIASREPGRTSAGSGIVVCEPLARVPKARIRTPAGSGEIGLESGGVGIRSCRLPYAEAGSVGSPQQAPDERDTQERAVFPSR